MAQFKLFESLSKP